jgi:hypothetical protein
MKFTGWLPGTGACCGGRGWLVFKCPQSSQFPPRCPITHSVYKFLQGHPAVEQQVAIVQKVCPFFTHWGSSPQPNRVSLTIFALRSPWAVSRKLTKKSEQLFKKSIQLISCSISFSFFEFLFVTTQGDGGAKIVRETLTTTRRRPRSHI